MKALFMTPLVILLLVILVFMAKMLDTDNKEQSPLIGKPVPAFELPSIYEGQSGLSNKDIKGYALVNVFASWCLTCKIEHSFLMELKKQGKLPIYGIDWKDKPKDVLKWLGDKGDPYTKIGADSDGKVILDFGVTGAPETFLISPNGIILYHYAGVLTKDVYEKEIEPRIK